MGIFHPSRVDHTLQDRKPAEQKQPAETLNGDNRWQNRCPAPARPSGRRACGNGFLRHANTTFAAFRGLARLPCVRVLGLDGGIPRAMKRDLGKIKRNHFVMRNRETSGREGV